MCSAKYLKSTSWRLRYKITQKSASKHFIKVFPTYFLQHFFKQTLYKRWNNSSILLPYQNYLKFITTASFACFSSAFTRFICSKLVQLFWFFKWKSLHRGRSSPSHWVSRVFCLVQIQWRKKIIIRNQPSGGSWKIFVEFFIDTCKKKHCRPLAYNFKY